ncbi:hypothetical protein ACFVIM_26545 [Streptomyces sp. NPDC057638]|uniref:hypothetical protein n=1 Tax=Streptomyces sp. NPDC057638 TaxID=3346190 RepID=UPI0036CE917F
MLSHPGAARRNRLPVLLGSVLAVGLLAVVGAWVYGVYAMSAPERGLLVGLRIDGSRVTVKAPTCPTDTVGTVEVFDSETTEPLWRASDPTTQAGKRGELTLWDAAGFARPGPQPQPARLPDRLDVAVEYGVGEHGGGPDGSGDVFDTAEAAAAGLPEGQYWTDDGPMTAAAIDGQLRCGSAG